MAFSKQKDSVFITIILTTALIVIPVSATTNIDCKGKAFHCVNSTHFKICVDFGGVSKTVDDFLIPCPPSTVCTDSNYYECELEIPTTSAAVTVQSDVTNELSETTVSSPWELFDVTTFLPYNEERSIELSENRNVTLPEIESEGAGAETADIVDYTHVNDFQTKVITGSENISYKTTVSDLSESESNISKPTDLVPSTTVTDASNGIFDNLTTNITYAAVATDNYSTTESATSVDLFNTIITTALNNVEEEDYTSTKLFDPVVTDNLSTNGSPERATIKKYTSSESEVTTDLYKPIITTPTSNIENEDFLSTTGSFPAITDIISTDNSATVETKGNYSSTKSDILIPTSNNVRGVHFTTTILPTITSNFTNAEINLTITDSNSATRQDTIERNVNIPTETARNSNTFYTYTVKKISNDRENDNAMHENGTNTIRIDESLSYSQTVGSVQTELPSSVADNAALKNVLEGSFVKEQKDVSFSVIKAGSLNAENIVTSSDIIDSDMNTGSYEENTQQYTTLTDSNQKVTQANVLNKKDLNDDENIGSNREYESTTELSSTVITESNSIIEKTVISSPDVITFTTTSGPFIENVQQDMAKKGINSPTLATTTLNTFYTNAAKNISQIDGSSMHENHTSALINADLPFTTIYDKEFYSTPDVNEALMNTNEEILATEENDTFLQISENHPSMKNINITLRASKTTTESTSINDLTVSYDENSSTASTNNENEFHTNTANKISNDTAEFLMHIKDTNKNVIDELTLPANTDLISSTKTFKDEISLTTDHNVDLNDTMVGLLIKENNNLPSPMNNQSSLDTEIIKTNLSSDMSDVIVTTEPYVSLMQQNMKYTNVKQPKYSTNDVTIQYHLTTQNMETETVRNILSSTVTKDEYRTTQDFATQIYDNDDNTESVSTPSMLTSFAEPEYKVKLTESSINQLEPVILAKTYEHTTNMNTDLSETQAKIYDLLSFTSDNKEMLINNTVKELSRNGSDDSNKYYSSHNNTSIPIHTTHMADNEQTTNILNVNLKNTSETNQWNLLNDTVQEFSILKTTPVDTGDDGITLTEFQSQPNTVINIFDYIITTNSYLTEGTEAATNSTEVYISTNKVKTDLKSSAISNDNSYNDGLTDHIYNSATTENIRSLTENYNNKYNLSENFTESSILDSDSSEIFNIINSLKADNLFLTLGAGMNSSIFAESNKTIIYNTTQGSKTEKSSYYKNNIDELSVNEENINNSTDKNQNNIRPMLEGNLNDLSSTTPIKNTFVSTERIMPYTSEFVFNKTIYATNTLKPKSAQLIKISFPLIKNNTPLEMKNENTLTTVNKEGLEVATLKINVTNKKPVHTATIHGNVNSSTYSDLRILKVTSLERLVNNINTSSNFPEGTTADGGETIPENSIRVTPNKEYVDNSTVSKNISSSLISPTNIYQEIETKKEDSSWYSASNDGINIYDKNENSVQLSNQQIQNTSLNINELTQLHIKKNIDLIPDLANFTKQINDNRFVLEMNDTHLYNQNVTLQALKSNSEMLSSKYVALNEINNTYKVINETYHIENKSITINRTHLNHMFQENSRILNSNTYNTRMSKNTTYFSNLSNNFENLTREDQKNTFKIISNKTIKDVIDINVFNLTSVNTQKNVPVSENENTRKEKTIPLTTVESNNRNPPGDIARTIIEFKCNDGYRGKYSDKNDCQNFYICIGKHKPISGKCPENTVFSEISKQCTKNLSHCIRNNQFQCTSPGRYVDIFSDHFYYICAKNVKGYIRFKLQCQKGYHLDKSKLQCILDSLNGSMSSEDSSKTDREKSTAESKSKEERDSKNQKSDFECKKEGKFVYPDDCKKYYQCTKNGKSEFRRKIKKCDSDEVFHNEKRKCVDEDSYESDE